MEKIIGITMGDVAGIGPELILKTYPSYNNIIVYGSFDVLNYYNKKFNYNYKLKLIPDTSKFEINSLNVIDPCPLDIKDFIVGKVNPEYGKRSYLYCQKAIQDAMENKIAGVVTCPLNKEALHLGGYQFDGHTEIFATLTNTKDYAMLLWSDEIKTIHVSTHCSLLDAIHRCKKDRIVLVTKLAYETMLKAGYEDPRIAIAGLNPHAGENGLFGNEEINEIIPAIEELRKKNINVTGPLPPDTIYLQCLNKKYDIVVSMYHDQGHIPLKLLAFDKGVNITIGLPIVRTSVDHGTAFDIAGKNVCDNSSLIKAIEACKKLT